MHTVATLLIQVDEKNSTIAYTTTSRPSPFLAKRDSQSLILHDGGMSHNLWQTVFVVAGGGLGINIDIVVSIIVRCGR